MKNPKPIIEISASQHNRDYNLEIDFIPKNETELKSILSNASDRDLMKMGCCLWTTYESEIEDKKRLNENYLSEGQKHFLFPFEWYNAIPNGFKIIDIFGEINFFEHGITSDDKRFGCLSFGFLR